ncbi:MAG: peptide-methionine (S)-S-oxide reductase, partial [Nitrospiria bacterium]
RQGADVGTQYRSVIFYHSPAQKRIAEQVVGEVEEAGIWDGPIVTESAPFTTFYRAEGYHQNYYKDNPAQPYCRAVIAPKLAKLRRHFLSKLKE